MKSAIRTSSQVGALLKQLRKSTGLSQTGLGGKLGLSQERVSAIENHPEKITLDQLLTILMALDAEIVVQSRSALADSPEATRKTASRVSKKKDCW